MQGVGAGQNTSPDQLKVPGVQQEDRGQTVKRAERRKPIV